MRSGADSITVATLNAAFGNAQLVGHEAAAAAAAEPSPEWPASDSPSGSGSDRQQLQGRSSGDRPEEQQDPLQHAGPRHHPHAAVTPEEQDQLLSELKADAQIRALAYATHVPKHSDASLSQGGPMLPSTGAWRRLGPRGEAGLHQLPACTISPS